MQKAIVTLLLVFLFLGLPIYLYAKNLEITADEFLINKEEDYIVARGNVIAQLDGLTLYADSAFLDRKNELLYIDGKIKFLKDFFGTGDDLKYDLKNKEGYIKRGELFYFSEDKKKQKFIGGEDIIIYDKDSFKIGEGYFSSCEGKNKSWQIKGKDININLGEYLTAKDVTLYGSSIPLFYSPYFLAPIKKEKESGFLIPTFGFSGKNGFVFNLPYYFFLDESYDDTLSLKLRTNNTIGLDNEFRYKLSREEEGILNLSLYENYDIKKNYLFLNFRHSKKNYAKVDVSLLNRRDFFYEYNYESDYKSLPYLRSKAFYERQRSKTLYSLTFFSGYNLTTSDKDFVSLSLNRDSYPLNYGRDFFYNYNGSVSFFSQGDKNFERLTINPYSIYRFSRPTYDLSLKMYGDLIYYKEDLKNEQKRGYLIINPDAKLYKTYLINDKYLSKNTLSLSPLFPVKVFDNLDIQLDRKDKFISSERLDYTLEQKTYTLLEGKLLYNLSLSQSYFLDAPLGKDHFSDISATFRTYFHLGTIGFVGNFNHKKGNFRDLIFYTDIGLQDLAITLSYNKNEFANEFANLDISKKITESIRIGFGERYDIKRGISKENRFIFDYLKNCYSIKIDIRDKKEPREFSLFIYINLYGLGEIRQAL